MEAPATALIPLHALPDGLRPASASTEEKTL